MARHRISSLDVRGIADFDELIHEKIHRILKSCLIALYFDSTTLIEIAVNKNHFHPGNWFPGKFLVNARNSQPALFRLNN